MQNIKIRAYSVFLLILSLMFFVPWFAVQAEAVNANDYTDIELYPGGMAFGVKISSPGLTIVKFSSKKGNSASSAFLAGLREGDIITKVNGIKVNSVSDFVSEVDKSGGKAINITALRNNKEMYFKVIPKYSSEDGKFKTGIWAKDSTTGIGTITFINPQNNAFGGLGHAICDSANGHIIPVAKGVVMDVSINGVIKGSIGTAGELKGSFSNKRIGQINKNCSCGVFGVLSSKKNPPESKMKICPKDSLKEGDAYIWCTLNEGLPKKYIIKIFDIDYTNSNVKNFKIKITDPELLRVSGGIVQGMSGSPIIQNGRLVGAVTHVLINDPTTGYGIFIENMLNSMPDILK